MRRRFQTRLRRAVRKAGSRHPDFARLVSRLENIRVPIDRALFRIVNDVRCEPRLRGLGARLLRDIGGDKTAFLPLLAEFVDAGDNNLPGLCEVILSMRYGRGRLARSEFDVLHRLLRNGTPEQRYCVVDHIAFFDQRQVRPALIEVLDDTTAPGYVRGWAAERLHLHLSHETVKACLRVIEDSSPEVRLWAVYTLGHAASMRPLFRGDVIPVLERMLEDDAVAPGWWSVRREAQSSLARLRGGPDGENRLQAEIQAILKDPKAFTEDKHWAWFNDESNSV